MNAIPEPRIDKIDRALAVFVFPFNAIQNAAKFAATAIASPASKQSSPVAPATSAPTVASEPTVRKPPTVFRAADRVHSHSYGGLKVFFYLYGSEKIIRAVARRDGKMKDLVFTAEIAEQCSLPFSLEAAVRWVGEVGFKNSTAPTSKTKQRDVQKAVPAAPIEATPTTTQLAVPAKSASKATSRRPFEGKVVSFGSTQRPPQGDKAGYTTYYLKLHSNLIGDREFIGEQLAELVEQYQLKAGQNIRLHPLGRQEFTVINEGKTETRHRNEYALDIL